MNEETLRVFYEKKIAQRDAEIASLKARIADLETPNQFWLVDASSEIDTSMKSLDEMLDKAEPYKIHEIAAFREMGLRWVVIVPAKDEGGSPERFEFFDKDDAEKFASSFHKVASENQNNIFYVSNKNVLFKPHKSNSLQETDIVNIYKKLKFGDCIIVSNLKEFGESAFEVNKIIHDFLIKGVSIEIENSEMVIDARSEIIYHQMLSLLDLSKFFKTIYVDFLELELENAKKSGKYNGSNALPLFTVEAILFALKSGMTIKEIAQSHSLTSETIHKYISLFKKKNNS